MWLKYSKYLLSSSKSSSLIYFELIKQCRREFSRHASKLKLRRSKQDLDQSNILRIESEKEIHRSSLLIRPTIFTLSFVGCSFVTCAIWQYESHRKKLKRQKENWQSKNKSQNIPSQLKNIWYNIPESKRTIGTIIGLNLIVLLSWRIKRFEPFLLKYFTSTPYKKNVSSMLLSTFSHYNGIHFLCNMYVLWSFSDPIIKIFGKEQFFALYLSGGVISSWLSYVIKVMTRTQNISLGASGSIMAILGVICTQYPDAELAIIFLPFLTFSAKTGIISMISFDLLGTIMRWRYLDHSAHLGGVFFGIFYVKYGSKFMWESLAPVVQCWHQLREKFK
ncbi:unnamed protein product [Rotaria magnacalcarata]|uniref:rhomboid protease n=4 Tax=Rotaria magnacalcarata TaxID=392030 RepID=A0A816FJ12_9BILA|nr:unnamed protein product [Rotaria magnacalcarata]CAF1662178.1 unnamed protein product [Rotaria magnacalcarata]CAF2154816.1 unnamed protein product [Rotaria magnacalcarata]